MKIRCIKFDLDGISIFCRKSEEDKDEKVSINYTKHIIINYDISLIHNPLHHVKEQYKLSRRDIELQHRDFVLFFPLDNIINPNDSQITLYSIIFYLKDGKKLPFHINQTYSFLELQKNDTCKTIHATPIKKLDTKVSKDLQKGESPSQTSSINGITSSLAKEKGEGRLFVDSFKKFKDSIQESELLDLFSTKEKALNSNLKSFGISLLCKLLLLVKYLNNLVDNEFQADLQKFLKVNLMGSEVAT